MKGESFWPSNPLSHALGKAQVLGSRRIYYWNLLKSLPYGVRRRLTRSKCRDYALIERIVEDREGLEIGGPSSIFSPGKLIPVYDRCRSLDNANYAAATIWDRPAGRHGGRFERQYVAEAASLVPLADEAYDFVLASHVLEHVANPLRALYQWKRVLRKRGAMLVIVPDGRATFDHRRPPTSFQHIAEDFDNNTSEEDLTHLDEVLTLHDLALDPGAGSAEQFRRRCRNNAAIRAMHHHVFLPEVLARMFSKVGMQVLSLAVERPFHIVGVARKVEAWGVEDARGEDRRLSLECAAWGLRDAVSGPPPQCASVRREVRG